MLSACHIPPVDRSMGDIDKSREAELVVKLHSGDPAAVEELYNTYFNRLYSLIFYQVGKDRQAAEDIVQETFLAALSSADKFRGQSNLYTWLCSIAHHKISDFYRQRGREEKYTNHHINDDAGFDKIRDSELPASASMESAEARQAVERALLDLPPDYRQVLILKYVEEISISEISQIMGRSAKSVEGLLTRARRTLRDRLAEQDEG